MENSVAEKFYRFVVGNIGIYQAVDRDCAENDIRRKNKPDGAWLPKRGPDFPGAISFWSEYGLKKYKESGLMDWHSSVVKGKVEVIVIDKPKEILYEDKYQIICNPDQINKTIKK